MILLKNLFQIFLGNSKNKINICLILKYNQEIKSFTLIKLYSNIDATIYIRKFIKIRYSF
jgi:hypothetical protein